MKEESKDTEISEPTKKKDKEDVELENALIANEFDLENIILIGEGEKTAEEIEDIKSGKPKEIEIKRSKKRKRPHVTCNIAKHSSWMSWDSILKKGKATTAYLQGMWTVYHT